MTHSTNYTNTLIETSADCARLEGTAPTKEGSVAEVQHRLICEAPYAHTSDDVIFQTEVLRGRAEDTAQARAEYFSVGRPCLRASPLVKTYGWGVHADAQGRIALIGRESADYARLAEDPSVAKVAGMRSKRR